jgi:CspA family cold shock protein
VCDDTILSGTVRSWSDEHGWGVLASDALDGTVFAHYSMIRDQDGWRGLWPGQQVWFTIEEPGQDGCEFRAVDVYATETRRPVDRPVRADPGAYSSSLTIQFDPIPKP